MRIAMLGAGGTGGYFGGVLARAGEDVSSIARGPHLEAMRRHGLTVKSRLAGEFTIPVKTLALPSDLGPMDLVLFCVKAYDTETAAAQLPSLMGPYTIVLPLQNGIDSSKRVANVVGSGAVLGGVAYIFSAIEAPGVIAQTAGRRLELDSLHGTLVRLGRHTAVPTPYNFAIYAALKPYIDEPPSFP